MPTYQYKCPSCSFVFDITKGFNEIDELESCPTCGRGNIEGSARVIGRVHFYGEKPDDPFFSLALGKVVKSKRAQLAEAKARGWEEVGNTDIEKHIDRTDRERQQKIDNRWNELIRG